MGKARADSGAQRRAQRCRRQRQAVSVRRQSASGMTGTPPGAVWEYDPAGDKWTKKKNMPLAAHHVAVAENGGKIYVFGGGVQKQAGGPSYVPVNNAWEYDPAADAWKALAAMPTAASRRSLSRPAERSTSWAARATTRPVMASRSEPNQPHRVLDLNEVVRPGDQHVGDEADSADTAQLDVRGRGERQDLPDRRPRRDRVRDHGQRRPTSSRNTTRRPTSGAS